MRQCFLFVLCLLSFSVAPAPASAASLDLPDCSRQPASLPFPDAPAGRPDPANPIQHIIVIMQENHSFDNYFGKLNKERFYGAEVDGVRPELANPDAHGRPVPVFHQESLCVEDPAHSWNAMHQGWNQGAMDSFVKTNDENGQGARVMGYYDETDLPYYYALADNFAIGDRYFASALTQTFPNRFYLYAATSFGHIRNLMPKTKGNYSQQTIFDLLDAHGVSWKYYSDKPGYLRLFQPLYLRNQGKMGRIADYEADLARGTLPQVALLDSSWEGQDEHPEADVQTGQAWVAQRIRSLLRSSAWKESVLFLTYDEGGGFYDHVPPPAACAPDSIAPLLNANDQAGAFDRYGFRVPFVAVSPYVKHHFVSHKVYDHSSILKFIETKFNLPALTARDANADGFSDLFDFQHPVFALPELPSGEIDRDRACNIEPAAELPRSPVSLKNRKTGLCLSVVQGGRLEYRLCDGTGAQKFLLREDALKTWQLYHPASSTCVKADWEKGVASAAACAEDEDQGFEFDRSADKKAFEFYGWRGQCLRAGEEGEPLSLGDCSSAAGIDFLLE